MKQAGLLRREAPTDLPIDDQRAFSDLRRVMREGARLLSLHRWFFFLPFCMVTSAVFVFSLYLPREYKATASIEIAADPVIANLTSALTSASFDKLRGTVAEDLRSPELHNAVLQEIGVKGGPANLAALRRALVEQFDVSSSAPSDRLEVVQLSYVGPDPEFGRRFLDALKQKYADQASGALRESILQQCNYLRQEYQQVRQEGQQAGRELTQLRMENPYADPSDPGALSLKIAQLEGERRDLLLRRREYEGEIAHLEKLLADRQANALPAAAGTMDPNVPLGEASRELMSQMSKLEDQILELRRSRGMTDQHPEMAALLSHRIELQTRLEAEREADRAAFAAIGEVARPTPLVWQPEFARLQAALDAEGAKLREVQISLATNEFAIEQLHAARHQLYARQEQFAEVTGRIEKARSREAQLQTTLGQLEPAVRAVEQDRLIRFTPGPAARVSDRPVAPNLTTVILFAIFAGLACGVIGLVLGEVFDQSFHSAEQVAASLNIPLLEVIDEIIKTGSGRHRLFARGLLSHACVIAGLLVVTGSGSLAYLCVEKPKLYDRVRQIPAVAAGLITSAQAGQG